jgi:hypothetical protein
MVSGSDYAKLGKGLDAIGCAVLAYVLVSLPCIAFTMVYITKRLLAWVWQQ